MSSSVCSKCLWPIVYHIDALFVETSGDLEAYKSAGPTCGGVPSSSPSPKCCAATTSILPQTTIGNLNELAGRKLIILKRNIKIQFTKASYQIYARKVSSDNGAAEKSPPALARWWDAYPKDHLTSSEVASLLRDPDRSDYAIIDVRENDRVVSRRQCIGRLTDVE